MPDMKTKVQCLVLRIELEYSDPCIWRRVRVPRDCTLGDLHAVIQAAFGWEDCHLHEFEFEKRRFVSREMVGDELGFGDAYENAEDERAVTIGELLASGDAKLYYTYDFGDNWRHSVLREDIVEPDAAAPVVLDGQLAGPPEDCGGVYGYYQLLDALKDADHPDHEHYLEWIGPIDETTFDAEKANQTLRDYFEQPPQRVAKRE